MTMKSPATIASNPLDLPEIRLLISRFLTDNTQSLYACTLVSRAWYADFIPQLWRTLRFDRHLSHHITPEIFQRHEHLIQELVVNDPDFFLENYNGVGCRNISRLIYKPHVAGHRWTVSTYITEAEATQELSDDQVTVSEDEDSQLNVVLDMERDRNKFLDLIDQQISLRYIHDSSGQSMTPPSLEFTSRYIMQHRPFLASLCISNWSASTQMMNMMIRNAPNLELLSLKNVKIFKQSRVRNRSFEIPDMNDENALRLQPEHVLDLRQIKILELDYLFLQMDHAEIRGDNVQSIELIARNYFLPRSASIIGAFNSRNFIWTFPQTSSLTYTGSNALLTDTEIDRAICGIFAGSAARSVAHTSQSRHIKEVALMHCVLPRSIYSEIVTHLSDGIEALDLLFCNGLSSANLQQIMTTCGNLRVFQGPEETIFWTKDMLNSGRPWASCRLETLVVLVGTEVRETGASKYSGGDIHEVDWIFQQDYTRRCIDYMFEQLSRQESLEILDLRSTGEIGFHRGLVGIPLTLKAGLDRLKGLKNLKNVLVTGWESEMGAAEAEWMLTHWPRIKNVSRHGDVDSTGWQEFMQNLTLI
ncbi:hypothetical protein BC939DRAFT_435650 [Gamsiella multidivaricata]|uniref:uncharacterized protein n=1 Tax=Gamsiella multidivaricata TaxID=101098 RepID=UPI002220E31E|nr:uncharacterized protein BC939DRAFT_435650 [Gamsiella multidivaricata]KAG0354221.1 hypothetical protein BGZ54_001742 [Gamsiella multidivaricata]KAI7832495.1 hypothetical protein BC939DRAFT_435650 [Gamsiella multidivaricata]